jgi:ubiquitin carboxyl-terminal hydrolase MINDY-1/2
MSSDLDEILFHLKYIDFLGRSSVAIICQNENGPCPLLAMANCLALLNKIDLAAGKTGGTTAGKTAGPAPHTTFITLPALIQLLANVFIEASARSGSGGSVQDQMTLDSLLQTLPRLARGLDLNVRFTGVQHFEFTEEVAIFDALGIVLLHAWVLDPQDSAIAAIVKDQSYNHLVFKLVEYRALMDKYSNHGDNKQPMSKDLEGMSSATVLLGDGEAPIRAGDSVGLIRKDEEAEGDGCRSNYTIEELELLQQGGAIASWLEETSQQMTWCGLLGIHQTLHDRQLAVLFHNNHFSTLFKFNGKLYLLVTDLGYREEVVVWECLAELNG